MQVLSWISLSTRGFGLHGHSFLRSNFPQNTRDCADMAIEESYCGCTREVLVDLMAEDGKQPEGAKIDPADAGGKKFRADSARIMAEAAVGWINAQLTGSAKGSAECAQISLRAVKSAVTYTTGLTKVVFEASPTLLEKDTSSSAPMNFEAMVSPDPGSGEGGIFSAAAAGANIVVVGNDVFRNDEYGPSAWCMKSSKTLEKMCFCRKAK